MPSPTTRDEGHHPPGDEPLWNESWYFDAVSDAGDVGLYVRLGRLPNQGRALYTACICGPGRPSILLVDPDAPLPGTDDAEHTISIDGLEASQGCEVPLQRWRVALAGVARSYDDPAAPLRGASGEPVEIALELTWETDGIPYLWPRSTRYEIPCRVSGAVRIAAEPAIPFTGPGQRDHSWGARDWWAADWVWSALHLDDGTHIHAVGLPQYPGRGVGYLQRGGELTEVHHVDTRVQVAPDGLIASSAVTCDGLELMLEPLGFGAVRLDAPDGRVSMFPRAMCRVRTSDGRSGSGWAEWNMVQQAS